MRYEMIDVPEHGEPITVNTDFTIHVPDTPIIPFVEGDGIGRDVTPVMRRVVDEAVGRAYKQDRRIAWMEIFAGQKASER
ncbi:MAG: NADP-dependent isocitrate dehydrogenase, partial [Gammaproteobacteria bacterium]